MKIPTRLLTATKIATTAFAMALFIGIPAAQPALADSKPPAPTTPVPHPPTGPLRTAKPDLKVSSSFYSTGTFNNDQFGTYGLQFNIKNIGIADSKPVLVYTYCGHRLAGGNVQEVAAKPVYSQPAIPVNGTNVDTMQCVSLPGQVLVSMRVLAVTEGDADTSNNQYKEVALG